MQQQQQHPRGIFKKPTSKLQPTISVSSASPSPTKPLQQRLKRASFDGYPATNVVHDDIALADKRKSSVTSSPLVPLPEFEVWSSTPAIVTSSSPTARQHQSLNKILPAGSDRLSLASVGSSSVFLHDNPVRSPNPPIKAPGRRSQAGSLASNLSSPLVSLLGETRYRRVSQLTSQAKDLSAAEKCFYALMVFVTAVYFVGIFTALVLLFFHRWFFD